MAFPVVISERAKKNLAGIFEYLSVEWSEKVLDNFKKKLMKAVQRISENPMMYPVSEIKKDIRKCVVTKHNILYYRIKNDEIEIITIHDTRKNPNSLNL